MLTGTLIPMDMEQDNGRSPERDHIFEKYLRLSRESERLKQRISMSFASPSYSEVYNTSIYSRKSHSPELSPISRTSSNSTTHYSSATQSPVLSPSLSHTAQMAQQHLFDLRYSPTPPLPNVTSMVSDEEALKDISQQIKATLTELINCPNVKHDQELRAWVQERLMDAEHEIRQQRRRRSSTEREGRRSRR